MNDQERMQFAVGSGVIGGIFLGWLAFNHMFIEGLSTEERNNILKATAATIFAYGTYKLVKDENLWWLNIQSAAEKAGIVEPAK